MLVSLDKSYELITEQERIDFSRNIASKKNRFTTRPDGILIQDSYNNPFFPIRPKPKIDTSKMDLREVYKRCRELYTKGNSDYLPWHYCVELVNDRFYAFNTRPLDMKFPLLSKEAKLRESASAWDEVTELFFRENIYDISNAVHICVVGDSNTDVYTKSLYNILGNICINPLMHRYRLGGLYDRIFGLNLGRRFNLDYLTKFIRI